MRLVTYRFRGWEAAGVVAGDLVVDIHRATGQPASVRELLAAGEPALAAVRRTAEEVAGLSTVPGSLRDDGVVFPLAEVRLAPPVPDPGKIICIGRNYQAHAEEAGGEPPKAPELFAKFRNALVGHEDPILIPKATDKVDYEGELAAVIGTRSRYLSTADALDHVAGYTICHDVSARDFQRHTSQWLAGKGMDGFAPMGPWLVTRDEVPDPGDLELTTRVDGEVLQHSNTGKMIFGVPELISYITQVMTLEPGDVISTGTPEGVGFARKPPRFLKPGNRVEITIGSIGTLANPVESEA